MTQVDLVARAEALLPAMVDAVEALVEDELITRGRQQGRGGGLHADPDHATVELAQLVDQQIGRAHV